MMALMYERGLMMQTGFSYSECFTHIPIKRFPAVGQEDFYFVDHVPHMQGFERRPLETDV